MRLLKTTTFLLIIFLNSCASGYKIIEPETINYISNNFADNVSLQYKYDLLDKKYAKKEVKKGVKLVAVKITNNSEKDLVFGKDIKLIYENGNEIYVMENEKVYKNLKQSPATYLFYLLLTPINFYTTERNSNGFEEQTSSFPIGLILGPGLAGGNMIAAGSANKKFKSEMMSYNIHGTVIEKGETRYGLIGIKSGSYDAIRFTIE